jgi:hypothetical protein
MAVRASITIDLPDNADYDKQFQSLINQISKLTGLETKVSVREIDSPISISPITIRKIKE